ncbi:sugar nucleotide-binding protein [Pseudoalteromonas sp. MMG022]|uniref:sugar nucleotide-binding protein n=1 Tax=Pseudoalteromonas sp. MMG022 TaxID=2909978 RepID=UPI001F380B54|nr:sugar nucleotide-binding protein [Pseudoalteromonas sp. MMG022]MCF6434683.1 sugar nucleotide-binding protein [Pseudoalteromonas sp. MMG022]
MSKSKTLIIGGDAALGRYLCQQDNTLRYTSRRNTLGAITFDLAKPEHFDSLNHFIKSERIQNVVVLAGITSIKLCEQQREYSEFINVERTKLLLDMLHTAGCFSIFLSTNHVFSCNKAYTPWNEPPSPCSVYGRQKHQVEQFIQSHGLNTMVVRPSKILTKPFQLIDNMVNTLKQKQTFDAFDDHYFSPVSAPFFARHINTILNKQTSGIVQISGAQDICYYEFLKKVAGMLNLNANLINPIKAATKGVLATKFGTLQPYTPYQETTSSQSIEDAINDYHYLGER